MTIISHTWQADQLPIELILDRSATHDRLQARDTDDWSADPWADISPSLQGITELLTSYALGRVSDKLTFPDGDYTRIDEALQALEAQREAARQAASALAIEAYAELFVYGLYVTNARPIKSDLPKRVVSATCRIADDGQTIGAITATTTTTTTGYGSGVGLMLEFRGIRYYAQASGRGDMAFKISTLLGPVLQVEHAASSFASDAAIILDCALDDALMDNYDARRAFPLREALATNNFKI